jgi:hypothetical protein
MATAFYPLGMVHGANSSKAYVSWKGSGEYANPMSVTSGNIRPLTNNDPTNNASYKHGLPRPIKHYRRGTFIYDSASGLPDRRSDSAISIYRAMETPGGFVQSSNDNCSTGNDFVSDWSPIKNLTQKPQVGKMACASDGHIIGSESNKALRRVRSASTILKKNYYQTSAEHLYNRCKTFDQVESHYEASPLNCSNSCANSSVYKPNNEHFAQQGAVSSSTRIADLKRLAGEQKSAGYKDKNTQCAPPFRRRRV